jgi:hypothetical protein
MTPTPPADSSRTDHAGPEPAAAWKLERADHGRLDFVSAAGRRHVDVDVVRAFPISAPAGPVAIVDVDGEELAWIDGLVDLDAPLRQLLEQELAQREFLPVIERIESVTDGEPMEWSVATDRGPRRFKLAHADDIAYAPDGGAFISDVAGVRYHIVNVSKLDGRSRRLLDRMD